MLERLIQHLYLTMGGPTCHHVRKAQHSHLTMGGPTRHHVRKAPHSHLTMGGPVCHHVRKDRPALISDHGRPIPPSCQKGPTLTSDHGRNQSYHHVRKALHLHLTMGGPNPATMSERLMDSSLPLGRNLDLENTKFLLEVLKLHSGHF